MTAVEGFASRSAHNGAMVLAVITATVAQMLDLGTFSPGWLRSTARWPRGTPSSPTSSMSSGSRTWRWRRSPSWALVIAIVAVLWGRDDQRRHPRLAATIIGFTGRSPGSSAG